MEFEIAVVSLLVIVYVISIVVVCLIIYICLKLRAINQSYWNIHDNPLYSRNRPQTTQTIETRNDIETVFETNRKSNSPTLKEDSDDTSHVYEDIDNWPGLLDNPNFPEPFYYCVDPESEKGSDTERVQCSDAESEQYWGSESEQCSCNGACACQKDVSV